MQVPEMQKLVPPPPPSSSADSKKRKYNEISKLKGIEFCEELGKYDKIAKIGQGTFGEVFKARCKKTNKLVALKRVLMDNKTQELPITARREIRILKLLDNENVVKLIEVCRSKATPINGFKSDIYLGFEFCEHDLAGLLSNVNVKFSLGEIKKLMQQLLNGLFFIQCYKLLHRDIKSANILITKNGVLKLADFGLTRFNMMKNGQPNCFTPGMVTIWYRPPELLLGARNYGPPVDMWGAGCIMAEMWTRTPIMQGSTEQHQLYIISNLCGSITPEVWPDVERLDLFQKLQLPKGQKRQVQERLKPYVKCNYALDLMDKLLTLDPSKRIDCHTALDHDFFWTDPMPVDLGKMMSMHNKSMFAYMVPPRKRVCQAGPVCPPKLPLVADREEQLFKDRVW